jgi:hypothetical protein
MSFMKATILWLLCTGAALLAGCRGSLFDSLASPTSVDRLQASSEHFDPLTSTPSVGVRLPFR